MLSLPDNVRQDLVAFVPASLLNEITCFVFYDNHPRTPKCIDITVCTLHGEVKEFYMRDLVNSAVISSCWKPQGIRILRNSKCELFYVVSFEDEIAILSTGVNLKVLHRISNVESYDVDDFMLNGQANLKIICKDDAVPLYFDNNFEQLRNRTEILSTNETDDTLPIVTQLARKLTEAQYSVKYNEKVLKDLSNLRQLAAFSNYKKNSPNEEAVFKEDKVGTSGLLKIKNQKPWIKMCNKKIVIILEVLNNDILLAENVHILFHTSNFSTVYLTKIFESISIAPYWKEKSKNTVNKNKVTAVVAVINVNEIKYSITSKINIAGAIAYKLECKQHLLPFEDITLSSIETMGENFDILPTIQKDSDKFKILALLATSEKTDLSLRLIKNDTERDLNLLDMFCEHLNMERIGNMKSVVLHRSSPYHILYGVMIVEENKIGEDKWTICLHTRSQDQILAFIHFMHDAIPHRIVATSTNQRISSKIPQLSKYDESTSEASKTINYSEFKLSMLNQTSMTLKYLDECMIKMNENKDPIVQSKMGSEIDIYAGGEGSFNEFRNKILEEAARGIESIHEKAHPIEAEGTVIILD